MFYHFGKATAIVIASWLVLSTNGALAAQNNYINPSSSSGNTSLKSGVIAQNQHQKERYLGSRLVFSSKYPITKLFIKDPGLSRACKRGRFRQIVDMQYIAIVNGRTYGAALYQRNMLYDPKQLADRDRIYLFKGQGTSNCKVYHKLR